MTELPPRSDLRVRHARPERRDIAQPIAVTTRRTLKPRSAWQMVATFGLVAVPVAMLVAVARGEPYLAAAAVAPMLIVMMIPWLRRVTADEVHNDVVWIMVLGLELRLLASVPRWLSGVDAEAYVRVGQELAVELRKLNLAVDTGRSVPGTGSIRYLTGVVQVLVNDSAELTTLVYTLGAFVGCVLVWRAATIALPDIDHRRMAIAVMVWPSLVYWPSSIGKEAVVMLGIGLFTVGAARRFQHQGGILAMGAGALTAGMVRPHIALLLLGAVLIATVLSTNTAGHRGRSAGKVVLVVILLGGLALTSGEALQLVETADDNSDSASFVEERTSQGGSAFSAATVRTPTDYPKAVITVLFRPFPWEATNGPALVSAAEGMALLVVAALRFRHVLRLPGSFRVRPMIGFALAYLGAFCYAFSPFGNFGLLARQRTQAVPFLLMLLLLSAVPTLPQEPSARAKLGLVDALRSRRSGGAPDEELAPVEGEDGRNPPQRWRSNVIAPPNR